MSATTAPQTAPAASPTTAAAPAPPAPADDPHSSLTATLAAGGPAVALIFGCWLLHEFGPWLLLGAMLLAAVALAVTIRMWLRARRRSLSPRRAGGATRGSPATRSARRGGGATRSATATGTGSGRRSAGRSSGGSATRTARSAKRGATSSGRSSRATTKPTATTATRPVAPAPRSSATKPTATGGGSATPKKRATATRTPAARRAAQRAAAVRRKSNPTTPKTPRRQRTTTATGRTKTAIPRAAAVKASRLARTRRATVRHSSKAASAMARRMRRASTSRAAARVRRYGTAAYRGARHAGRTVRRAGSPFLVHGFLAAGRSLTWARRHMLRLAAADGANWFAPIARCAALGLGGVLRTGQWVTRRRTVAAWMLRHHVATNGGTLGAAAARAGQRLISLAQAPTARPGKPVRILAPHSPAAFLGAAMGASQVDAITEAMEQFVGQYEPPSVNDLTEHLQQFAPLFEAFAGSFARLADRLQDDYAVEPGVVDMLQQLGSANAGMTDLCNDVLAAWRTEQEADLVRHEEPRPNEGEFWNYKSDGE